MSAQSQPNFVLLDADYLRMPTLIIDGVPGFADSPEYTALSDLDRQDPVVVCTAFACLLMRLQGEDFKHDLARWDAKVLEDIYKVLERLAGHSEASIRNAVMSDVFGTLKRAADSHIRVFVKSRLGPRSRALFEQAAA